MHHRVTLLVLMAFAALAAAGCGSSGTGDSTAANAVQPTQATTAQQASSTAPTTATTTTTAVKPTTTAAATVPQEKVIPIKAGEQTLKAGPLTLTASVTKLVEPLAAYFDKPGKGDKFVGVFVKSTTSGSYDPVNVGATTGLQMSGGKLATSRLISDGDCPARSSRAACSTRRRAMSAASRSRSRRAPSRRPSRSASPHATASSNNNSRPPGSFLRRASLRAGAPTTHAQGATAP